MGEGPAVLLQQIQLLSPLNCFAATVDVQLAVDVLDVGANCIQ